MHIFFLVLFLSGIKYDAEKEEKQLQEARQRELQRIEQTKLKAAEQGQGASLFYFLRFFFVNMLL